ncbi:hypothetical protein SDC9_208087 [bioreactor metagenome]|uniref:Uncharacterized protein n=1 Tax=bioreactor metagenome TaxID=1076179 RepID=A0A645JC86_9ZZZZ
MRRGQNLVQDFFIRSVDIDEIHAWRGHHDFSGAHVGHANHALQHDTRLGADDLIVFGFGQGFDQFIGRLRCWMDELSHLLQEASLVFLLGKSRRMGVRHCLGVQDVR